RSEGVAFAFVRPLAAVAWALTPATWGLQRLATSFTKLFGITAPTSQVSEQEIRSLIAVGAKTGEVEASEAALLEKVFRFGDQQVMDVMTPRPEIIWVERGTTLEQFLTIFAQHRHSRFPVFHESTENITGVLSVKDILLGLGEGKLLAEDSVTALLRTAYFVPETKPVSETFEEMQRVGHGMVLSVDEFGGIAGLATLEQLLEVIVGEMDEEGESPGEPYIAVDQETFLLDAGVGIAEINDQLALNLPEGQYQTVAGFVLDRLGRIPQVGDAVEFQDLRLTVTAMERVKIAAVEVRRTRSGDKPDTE
ncbi:MAG: hemolysin family protein, partial [Dehalococcoidia bacterium]